MVSSIAPKWRLYLTFALPRPTTHKQACDSAMVLFVIPQVCTAWRTVVRSVRWLDLEVARSMTADGGVRLSGALERLIGPEMVSFRQTSPPFNTVLDPEVTIALPAHWGRRVRALAISGPWIHRLSLPCTPQPPLACPVDLALVPISNGGCTNDRHHRLSAHVDD